MKTTTNINPWTPASQATSGDLIPKKKVKKVKKATTRKVNEVNA
tara:strand:+ start:398 stop:529 length:132 start_codon:yes stop_codon:yes gene_type:complete